MRLSNQPDSVVDPLNIEWCQTTYAALRPFAAPMPYLNYLDNDERAIRAPPFTDRTTPGWQEIKEKYDPDNFFHINVNIPPQGA